MTRLLILLALLLSVWEAQAQNMFRVRQTIDTLTSSTMHGRGYILQGDARAAQFLQDQFAAIGLEPLPEQRSYLQLLTLPVNRITQTPCLTIDGKPLKPGKEFVANAASPSASGTADVLLLDTLVFSDAAIAQKFFSRRLSKYALVYRQQDAKRMRQLPEAYQQQLQKAQLHVLLQQKLITEVAQQQSQVPELQVLASSWPASAKKIRYSIKAAFVERYQTQNVIGYVRGSTQPDSFLVYTAHYDHLGGQGALYFPGANDNASGTAMLLELAAYYAQPEHRPRYSIAFMAFAAEEAGLVGSAYYVRHPLFPLRQIRFLLNMDLLGTGSEGLMVVNGKVHEPEFRLLQALNQQHQYLPQIKARGKAANSDHYFFSEAGVPAFFFYTLGGTAAYHNVQDYASQLPLTKFPEVFQLITAFAAALQE